MKRCVYLVLVVMLLVIGCGSIQPSIVSFNAERMSIVAGESTSLTWNVTEATHITIDQGIGNVSLSGTRLVSPSTTTVYTLTASSSAGTTTATTQINVLPPPNVSSESINFFIAEPENIKLGDWVTLKWNVSGAKSIYIDNGIGFVSPSGSVTFLPSGTTKYGLQANNYSGGCHNAYTIVTVAGGGAPSPATGLPGIDFFNATSPIVLNGGSAELSWNTSNAKTVTIDNGIGLVDTSGSLVISPASSAIYTLKATNSFGSRSQNLSILVTNEAPILEDN